MALLVGVSASVGSADPAFAAKPTKTSKSSSSKTSKSTSKVNPVTVNGQLFLCYYPNKKRLKPALTLVSANKSSMRNSKWRTPVAIVGVNQTDIGGWSCP